MRKLFHTRNEGFTLAEMLVSMFILALVIGGAVSLFVSAFSSKRQVLAGQELVDQVSYLAEYMSRALRQAQKELSSGASACLSTPGLNYETVNSDTGIKFIDEEGDCRELKLEGTGILETNLSTAESVYLTSSDFKVTRFQFSVQGEGQGDLIQPRVTLLIEIHGQETVSGAQSSLTIQTTISQRHADIIEAL